MNTTGVFDRNLDAYNEKKRCIVNKGGTRSSKTYSILQLLYLIADISPKPKTISIVSESMPHLKKGCIRDFKSMLENENKWNENNWNATDSIYKINNSIIEFFSVDQPGKVHGPARDILFINECINIRYETYRQLAVRTRETIFLDYNPCHEFWVNEHILSNTKDSELIVSTYKDNNMLSEAQVKEIESNMKDPYWWPVYGLGETGVLVGGIMSNWDIVNEMPGTYKNRWIGIDFGFTNDPTAIVDIRLSEGDLWINEILYERGYDNIMISKHLSSLDIPKSISIVADCAEPKSIKEISSFGWRVEASEKGKDSVTNGLSILNRYKKHITKNSLNIINEYRNYKWQMDINGMPTNRPIDNFNHSIDAQRYVCLNKLMERNNSLSYSIIKGKKI